MAGLLCHVNSGNIALAAATAKTFLQIKAPANQRVILTALSITGQQPAGGTDTPIVVTLSRSTANFGTPSALTPAKNNPSDPETIQTTVAALTVEPTSPTPAGLSWNVQPQSGLIMFFPPDLRVEIPGGAALNITLQSPATPTLQVTASFQE
jgi:hypothetical protein